MHAYHLWKGPQMLLLSFHPVLWKTLLCTDTDFEIAGDVGGVLSAFLCFAPGADLSMH